MKRKIQKLALSRETVQRLEAGPLDGVAGGLASVVDPTCRLASCNPRGCSNNDICSSVCP